MLKPRYDQKKIRKKIKRFALSAGLLAVGGIGFAGIWQMKRGYREDIRRLEQQVTENRRTVYLADVAIGCGSVIRKDMLRQERVLTDLPSRYFFRQDDIGKLSAVDIEEGS